MSTRRNPRRRRRNWPICEATGKRRLGERKDVKQELAAARASRSQADLDGVDGSWTVVRGYRCSQCGGWHLTSRSKWQDDR